MTGAEVTGSKVAGEESSVSGLVSGHTDGHWHTPVRAQNCMRHSYNVKGIVKLASSVPARPVGCCCQTILVPIQGGVVDSEHT